MRPFPGPHRQLLVARASFATLCVMQKIFPGLGLWLALAAAVSGAEIKIDFNRLPAGSSPTNFHSAVAGGGPPGAWQIVMDEVPSAFTSLTPQQAPVMNRQAVLAQTSTDVTDEHFPLFIYDGETFKDFKLSTRFKIVGGTAEQMAGLVFRYQNASNFYVVRASALGHNVRFYKMVDGLRTDPIGPALDITTNVWHTLALQCQGNQITFWLDNAQFWLDRNQPYAALASLLAATDELIKCPHAQSAPLRLMIDQAIWDVSRRL